MAGLVFLTKRLLEIGSKEGKGQLRLIGAQCRGFASRVIS
jgi:hypothetical protein